MTRDIRSYADVERSFCRCRRQRVCHRSEQGDVVARSDEQRNRLTFRTGRNGTEMTIQKNAFWSIGTMMIGSPVFLAVR